MADSHGAEPPGCEFLTKAPSPFLPRNPHCFSGCSGDGRGDDRFVTSPATLLRLHCHCRPFRSIQRIGIPFALSRSGTRRVTVGEAGAVVSRRFFNRC